MDEKNWQNVKEIFLAALEKDGESRTAFLDEVCADDADLREEIESLLASHEEIEEFIETPVFQVGEVFTNGTNPKEKRLGNYKIIKEIGAGGMGVVYLAAREDEQFRKRVAIKLVKRGLDTEDVLRRFRNERQILASLHHPHIASLFDGGTSGDGLPFFVMEYIEGSPLLQYCDEHQLAINERLDLFKTICSAVQHAHQNLVIHRDLKPSNILITHDGEVKLLDFGVAKFLNPELMGDNLSQTQTQFRVMTPEYASPEQVRGGHITTATDIYSLGVILYELLTGSRPFKLKDTSPEEMMRLICDSEPTLPSVISNSRQANPKSKIQNPKLKGDLDNIILTALRKEPSRRYKSVEAFAGDIDRYLKGLPVTARPNTFKYRASKFIKRHKVGVFAASLILLSLIGGIVVSVWQARNARREKEKAEVVNQFLQALLGAANPETNRSRSNGHDTTVKELLDAAAARLETEDLSSQPEVKAELQKIIGLSYLTQGQYDAANKNLDAAIDAKKKLYGENSPETLQTLVVIGDLWINKGKYEEADKFYRQRLSILRTEQQKGGINTDYLFTAIYDFALLRRAQGDSREAESLVREALSLRSQTSSEMKSSIGIAESVLALTLADQGNFDAAEKIVRDKLTELRRQTNLENSEYCGGLTMFASILTEKGEYDEAGKNLIEAETIYRKLYRETYLPLGDNLRIQAQTLYFQNKLPEAETKINECLEIYNQVTSRKYANYAAALVIHGLILNKTNRAAEAEKILREAVKIRTENLPQEHFWVALAKSALGECLMTQKRFAEAETLLSESYENLKNSQGAENPRTLLAKSRLAALYEKKGK
jgi:eukaryotic-like serine/threonine-protein kinase